MDSAGLGDLGAAEAGAIRESEEHGWMQDRAYPHDPELALEMQSKNRRCSIPSKPCCFNRQNLSGIFACGSIEFPRLRIPLQMEPRLRIAGRRTIHMDGPAGPAAANLVRRRYSCSVRADRRSCTSDATAQVRSRTKPKPAPHKRSRRRSKRWPSLSRLRSTLVGLRSVHRC